MLTRPIKFSLFIVGLICAFISLLCSALLWISFSNNLLDSILLGITSGAFVAASYLFVPVLMRLLEFKRWAMLIALFSLEAILTLSSLAATVGFLESRYQNQSQLEISGSDRYLQHQARINNLTARINELTELAKQDRKTEKYRARAERLLNKADRLSQELDLLLNTRLTHTSQKAGNTLANDLGQDRYGLWVLMAVIIDGCPMACFALVSLKGKQESTPLPHPIKKPAPQIANTESTPNTHDLYQALAEEIQAGTHGEKPAMRNIIADKKIRYTTAKDLFEQLVKNGVLKQNGNRFERIVS